MDLAATGTGTAAAVTAAEGTSASPSTTEASRAVVDRFCTLLTTRDFDAMPSLFAADAVWWVGGAAPRVPYAGAMPATQRIPGARAMMQPFHAYTFAPSRVVAEGPHVMLEATARGTPRPRPHAASASAPAPDDDDAASRPGTSLPTYVNDVVMAFEVRDGRIVELREYIDNQQVEAYFAAVGKAELEAKKGGAEWDGETS